MTRGAGRSDPRRPPLHQEEGRRVGGWEISTYTHMHGHTHTHTQADALCKHTYAHMCRSWRTKTFGRTHALRQTDAPTHTQSSPFHLKTHTRTHTNTPLQVCPVLALMRHHTSVKRKNNTKENRLISEINNNIQRIVFTVCSPQKPLS